MDTGMEQLMAVKKEMESILALPEFQETTGMTKPRIKQHECYIEGFQAALDVLNRHIDKVKG